MKVHREIDNVIHHNAKLKDTLDETLRAICRHSSKSKVAGGTGLVGMVGGGVLTIFGIGLIPFSLGASATLAVTGGAIVVAGGATALGSLAAGEVLTRFELKEAKESVESYKRVINTIENSSLRGSLDINNFYENFENLTERKLGNMLKDLQKHGDELIKYKSRYS